jgi:hypothetical protein
MTGESQGDDEAVYAEPGPGITRPLAGDETLHRRARDRQCQPAADHGVDADDPAPGIDEWPPRVSGAQGDVGLEPVSRAWTFKGGRLAGGDDDAGRGRAAGSRRVPDRNGNLTGPHGAGIAEAGGRQVISGDLDDRQVAVGMAGGDDTGELAPVVEDDVDPVIADDMSIGDDDAVGAPDDAGAMASALSDEND